MMTPKKFIKTVIQKAARPVLSHWKPYSRLMLISDSSFWVISHEMRELAGIVQNIGIQVAHPRWRNSVDRQCLFYGSHLSLWDDLQLGHDHRFATAYFHGRPGTGVPEFDASYQHLCRNHERIARIQVSHEEMRQVLSGSGIAVQKVHVIPIGINLGYFRIQTVESKKKARTQLGIPQTAFVVGSFQKDGVGWGDGNEPKLIKGPDVFLRVIEILQPRIPDLYVLLSGPARGYIRAGLERLGVPYSHRFLGKYPEIGVLYEALDAYLVASRQEGGPKAVLESMATGVPLVTTCVGQAMDLVQHGINGWIAPVEEADELAYWIEYVREHRASLTQVLVNARETAEQNAYPRQLQLWESFMEGFVEW